MTEVKIIVTDANQVRVEGIVENQIFMYGLMYLAQEIVKGYFNAKAAESRIVPATLIPKPS